MPVIRILLMDQGLIKQSKLERKVLLSLEIAMVTCVHTIILAVIEAALCEEKTGKLKTPVFLCPYHQWSYSLEDGRLIKTSSFKNPDNFIKENYGLFKVKLQEWRGCIFINLDEESEWDVDNLFQRSANELERFPIEDMKVGSVWKKTIKCNWKSFWENFNECLHCPNVHPELSKLVPLFSKRIIN